MPRFFERVRRPNRELLRNVAHSNDHRVAWNMIIQTLYHRFGATTSAPHYLFRSVNLRGTFRVNVHGPSRSVLLWHGFSPL